MPCGLYSLRIVLFASAGFICSLYWLRFCYLSQLPGLGVAFSCLFQFVPAICSCRRSFHGEYLTRSGVFIYVPRPTFMRRVGLPWVSYLALSRYRLFFLLLVFPAVYRLFCWCVLNSFPVRDGSSCVLYSYESYSRLITLLCSVVLLRLVGFHT